MSIVMSSSLSSFNFPDIECTFMCGARFLAFGDWVKHEQDVHWPETERLHYICPVMVMIPGDDGKPTPKLCGRVVNQYAPFRDHFLRAHPNISKTTKIPKDLFDSCSISSAHGYSYWCGFCNTTKKFHKDHVDRRSWWEQRADHIQTHIEERGKQVSKGDWKTPQQSFEERWGKRPVESGSGGSGASGSRKPGASGLGISFASSSKKPSTSGSKTPSTSNVGSSGASGSIPRSAYGLGSLGAYGSKTPTTYGSRSLGAYDSKKYSARGLESLVAYGSKKPSATGLGSLVANGSKTPSASGSGSSGAPVSETPGASGSGSSGASVSGTPGKPSSGSSDGAAFQSFDESSFGKPGFGGSGVGGSFAT